MSPRKSAPWTALAVDIRFRIGRAVRIRARRLADRLVVRWCRLSGSHFIEPWAWYIGGRDDRLAPDEAGHSGCTSCTWCVECGSLLGRDAVDIWS